MSLNKAIEHIKIEKERKCIKMSDENILSEYIELINKGYCLDCNELNCIDNFPHKKIANAIEQLQQENEQLKLTLKGTTHCFDEEEHQRLNNILNEFEKWLEKQKKKLNTSNDFDRYARLIIIESLDKLQELKEGKK